MEQKDNLKELKYIQPDSAFLNDDLFIPSDSVWNKIESEISQKKKKRRFFWSWFSVLLLVGSISLLTFYFKMSNNSKIPISITIPSTQFPDANRNKSSSGAIDHAITKTETVRTNSENSTNASSNSNLSTTIFEAQINSNQVDKPLSELNEEVLSTTINLSKKTNSSYHDKYAQASSIQANANKNSYTNKSTRSESNMTTKETWSINNNSDNNKLSSSANSKSNSTEQFISDNINLEQNNQQVFDFPFIASRDILVSQFVNPNSINQLPILPVKITKNFFPYYIGGFIGKSVRSDFRNKLTDNLAETIEKSYSDPNYIINLNFSQPFHNNWSYHVGLEYFQQRVYTDYDLNIPYDLMTEKQSSAMEATNEFIHSLPTYQGNISTDLIVTRSTSTPITHNENINVNLITEGLSRTLQVPLGVQYHFSHYSKKFSLGLQVVPGLDFDRSINIVEAKSLHTYVKEKDLIIKVEDTRSRFLLGYGIFSGYRFKLSKQHCIDSQVEYRLNQINKTYIGNFGIRLGIQGLFF